MFERFTDKARRAIVLGQEESRDMHHDYIGTEHLLLGILRVSDSVAAMVLDVADVSQDSARRLVEELVGRGTARPTHHIPFTPRAKKVMEYSLREAVSLGHNYIGTEHLLLGIIREGEGVASQVLSRLAVDAAALRDKVLETVGELHATGTDGATTPSPVRADGVEDFLAPTCPGCRAAIEETAAFKVVHVPQDGGDGRVAVQFVFCEACGRTLTSRILDA